MVGNKRAITRRDVAELAGVSASTVSLVLNNTPNTRISEDTRKRVMAAADKVGYRPSAVARALVTGKTNTIGVLIFYAESPFDKYTGGILSAFWNLVHKNGYRLTIDGIPPDGDASVMFRERAADGVLLLVPPPEIKNLEVMIQAQFPLVCVGSTITDQNIDYVDTDNYMAGKDGTQHLLDRGHKKILHIAGPVDDMTSARDRLRGYRDAMEENGIGFDPAFVVQGNYLAVSGKQAMHRALQQKLDLTAVFAANDGMARGAMEELRNSPLRVPDDVSVVGVNNDPAGEITPGDLTAIQQPMEAVGHAAAEIMLSRIRGNGGRPRQHLFRGRLISGSSVRQLQ